MRFTGHRWQQHSARASAPPTGPPRVGDAPLFITVASVVFLTRIPFLDAGYGSVHDAWRVAFAARQIAVTHTYWADRYPPHPIQDVVSAVVWPGGAVALNGATALWSGVAAGFFALLIRATGGREFLPAAFALALTPVIFVDSTSSLDYLWALAFILGSFYFMLTHRPLYAGIFLGLAIGCRVTSVLMLAPLGLLVLQDRSRSSARLTQSLAVAVPAAVLGVAAYVPGLLRYGSKLLGTHGAHESTRQIVYDATVALWGDIGTLALLGAVALLLAALVRVGGYSALMQRGGVAVTSACVLAIVVYGIGFLLLPAQPGYLVPIVPFVILILAVWLPRMVFLAVCIALMLSSFIGVHARGITSGPIFSDHADRLATMRTARQILAKTDALPSHSVVVAGHWLPIISVYLLDTRPPHARFVWLMNRADLAQARRNGQSVYYLPGQRQYNEATYGTDLERYGAQPLLSFARWEQITVLHESRTSAAVAAGAGAYRARRSARISMPAR